MLCDVVNVVVVDDVGYILVDICIWYWVCYYVLEICEFLMDYVILCELE